MKWFTKAAEQGDADAQGNLGYMYYSGEGVLADYRRAYMWWNLASYNGDEEGSDNRDKIAKEMTRADISKAQQMASRCLESNYTDCWMIDKDAEDSGALQQLAEVEQALDSLLVDEGTSTYSPDSVQIAAAVNYMKNEIIKTWTRPANARNGMVVELVIHLVPTGEVVDVEVSYRDPSATDAFVASVENAVKRVRRFDKLSQLNSVLFETNFRRFTVRFRPEDLRL